MLPTMAGAANRCVIPEYEFDIDHLARLLIEDRNHNPSRYSVVLVSEGAMFKGGQMIFSGQEKDAYGHAKLEATAILFQISSRSSRASTITEKQSTA
jgi:6-phosphofructokinase 1